MVVLWAASRTVFLVGLSNWPCRSLVRTPVCLTGLGGFDPHQGRHFVGNYMYDMEDTMKTPEFKKEFWIWFDSLSSKEREKFNTYKADMAEINFYNTQYRKRLLGNNSIGRMPVSETGR